LPIVWLRRRLLLVVECSNILGVK